MTHRTPLCTFPLMMTRMTPHLFEPTVSNLIEHVLNKEIHVKRMTPQNYQGTNSVVILQIDVSFSSVCPFIDDKICKTQQTVSKRKRERKK